MEAMGVEDARCAWVRNLRVYRRLAGPPATNTEPAPSPSMLTGACDRLRRHMSVTRARWSGPIVRPIGYVFMNLGCERWITVSTLKAVPRVT